MKVYVDELPKSCDKCPFHCQTLLFAENHIENAVYKSDCRLGFTWSCRLQSLVDYTKQVRKEVLADLKEKYKQKMANALGDDEEIGHMNCDTVLEELLEEIGFDEVLELYRSQGKWYA